MTYEDIKSWGGSTTHQGYKIIVDAFKDGRADLLFAVVTPKHPSITEMATFSEIKFLPLEAERVKGLGALGYASATMPPEHVQGPERSRCWRWAFRPCSSPTRRCPSRSPTRSPRP